MVKTHIWIVHNAVLMATRVAYRNDTASKEKLVTFLLVLFTFCGKRR
jgi:hypothetical protein